MRGGDFPVYWRRLRAMRPAEMAARLRTNLAARWSRLRGGEAVPALAEILAEPELTPERLLAAARQRQLLPPLRSLPADTRASFPARWPEAHTALLAAAARASAGRFSLLGAEFAFAGPIDWHYDPLARRSMPLAHWTALPYWRPGFCPGVRQIWELNRHQHFVTLAQAWQVSGDPRWSRALTGQWLSWIDTNPPGRGINWTSALELGLRLISWSHALEIVKSAPDCSSDFYARLLPAVHLHAEHIRRRLSRGSSANNHFLGECAGLICAGLFFPELRRAGAWLDQGLDLFWPEFLRQVHEDGVIREQSTGYQRYLYDYGVLAIMAAAAAGRTVPAAVHGRLERIAEFVAALIDAAGEVPQIGDSDDGQLLLLDPRHQPADATPAPTPWQDLLGEAALRFGRSDFAGLSAGFSPALFWRHGAAAAAKFPAAAAPARAALQLFPEGGYAIMRRSDNGCAQLAVLDAGPLGLDAMAAHGHADALSFLLSAGGQPLLIDSGTYTYRGEARWRDYFRGTAAHNTIRIASQDQSQRLGPFQWGRQARARLIGLDAAGEHPVGSEAAGEHDGYRHLGILHRRSVRWQEGSWRVEDHLSGKGTHTVELFWHLAPCRWRWSAVDTLEAEFPGCRLLIRITAAAALQLRVVEGVESAPQGWYSPRFGQKKANPVLCVNTNEPLPVHIMTEIRVAGADRAHPREIERS